MHRDALRYVLRCATCGEEFDEAKTPTLTMGEVQTKHFMRKHDTSKISLELYDRWTKTARALDA
jgi:hypothetical protein